MSGALHTKDKHMLARQRTAETGPGRGQVGRSKDVRLMDFQEGEGDMLMCLGVLSRRQSGRAKR